MATRPRSFLPPSWFAVIALAPLVFAMVAVVTPRVAHACSCVQSEGALPAAQAAAYVFEGKALGVEVKKDPPPKGVNPKYATEYKYFEFKVERSWKGELGETVTVKTAMNGAACGIDYKIGASYLIYARDQDGQAATSACSRTRRSDSDQAKADFEVLDGANADFTGPKDPPPEEDAVGPAEPEPTVSPDPASPSRDEPAAAAEPEPTAEGQGCSVAPTQRATWWLLIPVLLGARRRISR